MAKRVARKRRRPNGEGHIRRRKDGRYERQVTFNVQGKAFRRSAYGLTIRELNKNTDELRRKIGAGWLPGHSVMRVRHLADQWRAALLDDARLGTKSTRTYDHDDWLLRFHILPELGDLPIGRVTKDRFEDVWAHVRSKGLSERTCSHAFATCHRMFQFAVEKRWLTVHPMNGLKKPSPPPYDQYVLSRDEARRFLDEAAREPHLGRALVTLLSLGLRSAEALGLRMSALDERRGQIHIRAQLLRLSRGLRPSNGDRGHVVVERPKWGSTGTLSLPEVARRALRAQAARQAERRLAAGPNWRDIVRVMKDGRFEKYADEKNDLYFTSDDGRPLDPHVVRDAFVRVCDRAGIPWSARGKHGLRLHDLRASASTLLAEQGASAREIMAFMRHKSPQMFLHYTKVEERVRAKTAARMDEILAG